MVANISVPYRPVAVHPRTGFMTTDGIFLANMGEQIVRASFVNNGPDPMTNVRIYMESLADPGISQLGDLRAIDALSPGASVGLGFRADFRHAIPGETGVSFIVECDGQPIVRIIKKIFVCRIDYDEPNKAYSVALPQGTMRLVLHRGLIGPSDHQQNPDNPRAPHFVLPQDLMFEWVPSIPYNGERGPYPFEDPLWKVILGIVAGLVGAAGVLYDYFSDGKLNGGMVKVSGKFEETAPSVCCAKVETQSQQGFTEDPVTAGLYSAAGAIATLAIASDGEDPHYCGQAATFHPLGKRRFLRRSDAHRVRRSS